MTSRSKWRPLKRLFMLSIRVRVPRICPASADCIRTGYTAMRLRGREVRSEIEKRKGKFDDIISDVGGRDNEGLRAALTVARLFELSFRYRSNITWLSPRNHYQ
jgi:hypothetical protein